MIACLAASRRGSFDEPVAVEAMTLFDNDEFTGPVGGKLAAVPKLLRCAK